MLKRVQHDMDIVQGDMCRGHPDMVVNGDKLKIRTTKRGTKIYPFKITPKTKNG